MLTCRPVFSLFILFLNDTATTEIYTLSLHDALPILLLLAVSALSAKAGSAKTASINADAYGDPNMCAPPYLGDYPL